MLISLLSCNWDRFVLNIYIYIYIRSRPHTKPEKFENGAFTLKTHQIFSAHTTPEEFQNAAITGHLGDVFEEISGREIT